MSTASTLTHIYVGVARSGPETRGGLFRRAPGDDGWTQLTRGLPEGTAVQAITVHPADLDVIYAIACA